MSPARIRRWWYASKKSIPAVNIEIEREDGSCSILKVDLLTAERVLRSSSNELSTDDMHVLESNHRLLQLIERIKRFLSYRPRSSGEVVKKLHRLGCSEQDIRNVVEYLTQSHYLSDEQYARSFVRDCVRLRMLSAKAIRYKLLARGIPKDIAERAIAAEYPDDDMERAKIAAQKTLRRVQSCPREKQYRRVRDALLRLGYSSTTVRQVLTEMFDTSS
ncbi:MAG: RecX family transcriptional regulator [Bacteroidota bacterium]|nr:RecX family transcriptional regulator [Candidatus Kapabacteria bacterium]MCX7936579.1 RecX family transcriptional regulator [Chlorobiota bacterium]MDW8074772.1 RecX family transcriptional regulator [Bacteroidota bacterium]MDW8271411.1 RecX family transcriptional regulator [Bacteroidota bacterium]